MTAADTDETATRFARQVNAQISKEVDFARGEDWGVQVASKFATYADSVLLWRAALMRAQGAPKLSIAKAAGWASSGSINQRWPELDDLAAQIKNFARNGEPREIVVRGVSFSPKEDAWGIGGYDLPPAS